MKRIHFALVRIPPECVNYKVGKGNKLERVTKINMKKWITKPEAASPYLAHRARRLPLTISLLLSLSAGALLFGPLGHAAHSSASGELPARAANGGAVPFQTGAEAVRLNRPFGTFSAEKFIPVVRCIGGFIGTGPDCPSRHLHALLPGGIIICGQGPFPDPSPEGCGYGPIVPFQADLKLTVFASTVHEPDNGGLEFYYDYKIVNNGPVSVDDVPISLEVTVDGKQDFSGTIPGPGQVTAGSSEYVRGRINLAFTPDANKHSVVATFTASEGVRFTCGPTQSRDSLDDPNPTDNVATVTDTARPAEDPLKYPKTFNMGLTQQPMTGTGNVFLTGPLDLPLTIMSTVPLTFLVDPGGASSQATATPLTGDGHGGFAPITNILPTVGSNPSGLILAPIIIGPPTNHLDIGISNRVPGSFSVFGADGAGGFNPPITTPVGGTPIAFTPLDFNGDKKLDLAIALAGANPGGPSSIVLFQGDGTGKFSAAGPPLADGIAPSALPVGMAPSAIVTADFNGDGKADLAVANAGAGNVTVFLGDGKGGFSSAGTFTAGSNPSALAVGDLNGDGKPDLVVANQGEDTISVLLGDGAGHLTALVSNIPAGPGPAALAIADFNGDGTADVAVADGSSNTVTLSLGDGSGFLGSAATFQVGANPSSLVVGDFDGDGKPDLAVGSKGNGTVTVLLSSAASITRPAITQATKSGKQLLITGSGFDNGATILVDGQPQRTANDSSSPTTSLTGKKAGKRVSSGSVVQVQNSTGILSEWLIFGK
jgi:hypothetical protein